MKQFSKRPLRTGLAILVSAAAPLAAQAQSSVTIFGVIDTAFTRDSGSVASVSGISSGNNTPSRLGFRGTEDLGGGLKAAFWLEIGFSGDGGQGVLNSSLDNVAASTAVGSLQFGRRSTVSLLGNFGELRLGRDIVPVFYTDVFTTWGVTSIATDVYQQANLIGQAQQRTSNGIHYFTPDGLLGFYGQLHYAFGEQVSNLTPTAAKENGDYFGLRVGYKSGPLDVAFAYGQLDLARVPSGVNNDRSVADLAGSYDFGVVKINGVISRQTINNTVGSGFTGTAGTALLGTDTQGNGYGLSAVIPLGAHNIRVGYSAIGIKNGHGLGTEPKAGKFALGYLYNFSKRTVVYTTVTRLKNSGDVAGGGTLTAGFRVPGLAGAVAGPNSSSTAYELGIRHSF